MLTGALFEDSETVSRELTLFFDAPDHLEGSRRDKIPQFFANESVSQVLPMEEWLPTFSVDIRRARTVASIDLVSPGSSLGICPL